MPWFDLLFMSFEYLTTSLEKTHAAARDMVYRATFLLAKRDDGVTACARLPRRNSRKLEIGYCLGTGRMTHWVETGILPTEHPGALEYWVKKAFFYADGHIACEKRKSA
jgi:hypothetical protein